MATLRQIPGVTVMHINGTVDICVGHLNRNYLFEIKRDKKAKMKDSQIKFFAEWKGQITRVESAQEILDFLRWQKREYTEVAI